MLKRMQQQDPARAVQSRPKNASQCESILRRKTLHVYFSLDRSFKQDSIFSPFSHRDRKGGIIEIGGSHRTHFSPATNLKNFWRFRIRGKCSEWNVSKQKTIFRFCNPLSYNLGHFPDSSWCKRKIKSLF